MGSPLICLCKDRERERGPLSGDGHLLQATQKTVQHQTRFQSTSFPVALYCHSVIAPLPIALLPNNRIVLSLYIIVYCILYILEANGGEIRREKSCCGLEAIVCGSALWSAPGRGNSGARPAVFFLIPPCYIIQLHRVCFYLHTAMTSCLLLESTLPPIRNSRFPILDSRLSPKIGRTLSIPTWRAVKVRYRQ